MKIVSTQEVITVIRIKSIKLDKQFKIFNKISINSIRNAIKYKF